jgi:hypothetical protein
MAEVIEKARKKLASLEREIAELRIFIEVYDRLADDKPDTKKASGVGMEMAVTIPPQGTPTASPAQIVTAAKLLMGEKQRPLTRTELVRLLTLRGLKLPGNDLAKNIGTIVWRSHQFVNVEGKGYWPKDAEPWQGRHPEDELFVRK